MHTDRRQPTHARHQVTDGRTRAYRTSPKHRQGPNLRVTSLITTGVVAGILAGSLVVAHDTGSTAAAATSGKPALTLSSFTVNLNKSDLRVERQHLRQERQAKERRLRRERAARRRREQQAQQRRIAARQRRIAAQQPSGTPQQMAETLVLQRGWSQGEFNCLDALWNRESGWSTYATNGSSGAYGIPQALPGDKMATAGADWRTNPLTQIKWGLDYIAASYGSPCAALAHSNATGFY